jgi:type III secretory pathway component EscT
VSALPTFSKYFLQKWSPLPMLTCDFVLTLLSNFSDIVRVLALAAPASALAGMRIVRCR